MIAVLAASIKACLRVAVLLGLAVLFVASPIQAQAEEEWFHLGLVRVRDLTPFGILRLDMLPPHSVASTPGTWAIEANLSYQNTFVLSENVAEYLRNRNGGERARITDEDIQNLLDSDGDVYLIDGELGLADLTLHYRFSPHWGAYLTQPVLYLDGGFLDGTIESFHRNVGLSTANRDLAQRNRFVAVFGVRDERLAVTEPPFDSAMMDPVIGLRYSLFAKPESFNVVMEAAVKAAFRRAELLRTTGSSDYGLQVSLQKFAVTENLANFENTPDVGITLSLAKVVFGGP